MLLLHWGSKSLNLLLFFPGSCRLATSRNFCISLMGGFLKHFTDFSLFFHKFPLLVEGVCLKWCLDVNLCSVSGFRALAVCTNPLCAFQALDAPVCSRNLFTHFCSNLVCAYFVFDFCLTDEPGSLMLPEPCSNLQLLLAQVWTPQWHSWGCGDRAGPGFLH